MSQNPEVPCSEPLSWSNVDAQAFGGEVRLVRTRLNLLEDEMRTRFRTLDERMDALERELDKLING